MSDMLKRTDLPADDAIIDYGDVGFGPVMWHWSVEGDDLKRIASEHGFEARYLPMDSDLSDDDPIYQEYEGGSDKAVSKWKPPAMEGFKLVAKHDTDDGPVAWYIRRKSP